MLQTCPVRPQVRAFSCDLLTVGFGACPALHGALSAVIRAADAADAAAINARPTPVSTQRHRCRQGCSAVLVA